METVHIRVPFINGTLASIYAERLKFGGGNGDGVAALYEDVARPWKGDQYVALCPQVSDSDAPFDCVHSVFGATMRAQTFSMSFLSAHGLFCLAAHLKETPHPELAAFTGVVYGFGSSKLCEMLDMNHEQGSPWTAQDLKVPVLYIVEGRPASIYTYWHTATPEEIALIAYSGDDTAILVEHMATAA